GDAAELLLDHRLLDHGKPEATVLLGVIYAGEAPVAHGLAHAGAPLHGQLAMLARHLFQRDQHLVAELAGARGKLLFARRELEIHFDILWVGSAGRTAAARRLAAGRAGGYRTSGGAIASHLPLSAERKSASSTRAWRIASSTPKASGSSPR